MNGEITKDYMYLIVKDNNRLQVREEKIEYNSKVESLMRDFLKDKNYYISQNQLSYFQSRVKYFYPDFFKQRSFAIEYSSFYQELGFHEKCNEENFKASMKKYLIANALDKLYIKYQNDNSIVAYSHRIRGWHEFCWNIDKNFKFRVLTNFAYGASSYFEMILYWKELPIINYLSIIFYRFAQRCDIHKVTESYYLRENEWKTCFDNTIYYVNTFYEKGEKDFIRKYLDDVFLQLINGLEINLNTNLLSTLNSIDINNLFMKENYFSEIYLYKDIGSNILNKINEIKVNDILNIYHNDLKFRNIINNNISDIDYILAKFINNYDKLAKLERKAKIYIFMLNLLNIQQMMKDNKEIESIFNYLYLMLKAQNNYDDNKFLILINDNYELQIKRSEQCLLTIKAINNTKNSEMMYLYNQHKIKLSNLITMLKIQNTNVISDLKEDIIILKNNIALKTIEKDNKFEILETKQSYKNDVIYNLYFDLVKKHICKLVVYDKDGFKYDVDYLNSIVSEIIKIKKIINENNFNIDDIINLEDFGLEDKTYYISYDTFKSFPMKKSEIITKYLTENKPEKEKVVLCCMVSIFKNIHEIIKNLFIDINDNKSYEIYNKKLQLNLYNDMKTIVEYCSNEKFSDEQYSRIFNSFIELYLSVFKINKLSFLENSKLYNEDSKQYNIILNELSNLNLQLNKLKSKVNELEKYNSEIIL